MKGAATAFNQPTKTITARGIIGGCLSHEWCHITGHWYKSSVPRDLVFQRTFKITYYWEY